MRILLVGRSGGITHWLEDAAAAFRAASHAVGVAFTRRPWLNAGVEGALAEPLAAAIAARARRFDPDLILVIGGFHAPRPLLERLAALPSRAPLAAWVGDLFPPTAAAAARLYDLIAYTDSGLLARHVALGFAARAIFLPHAANPAATPAPPARRARRMVLVASATAGRRRIVEAITTPISVHGPGWSRASAGSHDIHPGRTPHQAVAGIHGRHLAVLNIRNEVNVLRGLNQRNFDPCLAATPVLTDDQADLETCFDPGVEALVWRGVDELNALHERLLRDPAEAAAIGEAGRRRVLAEHTFTHRLATLRAAL